MLTMILKMTAATALYIFATVMLWRLWRKTKDHHLAQKMAIGFFYGLCSVVSNHIGIDYGDMVLNVRDLGPLAAGLFFDPLAGILSGLIGGIERFVIGEYFGIGSFTRVACSISTILAGLLSAALHKWAYSGRRPSGINCLFLGAEMEVFHMYAVFITNRSNMYMASRVVEACALPMIAFTGIGLMLCTVSIARQNGFTWKGHLIAKKRDTPIDTRYQRWLLVLVSFLFGISFVLSYSFQSSSSYYEAESELTADLQISKVFFSADHDLEKLQQKLDTSNSISNAAFILLDAGQGLQLNGLQPGNESESMNPELVGLIVQHAGAKPFHARNVGSWEDEECLCVSEQLDESHYLMVALPFSRIYENRRSRLMETLFLEILIFTALYVLIGMLVNNMIVHNLERVNKSLSRITEGHLNETVAVEESSEFTKLSEDINKTVTALRQLIDAAEKRMEEELRLAAAIQDSALPKNFNLPYKDIQLHALMMPARQVGGDFYDFFFVNRDQIALVIADVSGKGIPAAMFMMRAKTAIKTYARNGLSSAGILENVNNVLCEDNKARMFVTVWLGILDLKTGTICCANAGHEYPALMRAGSGYELLKDKHGPILGVFSGVSIPEYEIRMNPGDRLFVYTDGVPEAFSEDKQQYGTTHMTVQLTALKEASQEQLLTGMLEDIRRFAGDAEQFDDITMLGITWCPQNEGSGRETVREDSPET